jgi:hypothetical protein
MGSLQDMCENPQDDTATFTVSQICKSQILVIFATKTDERMRI